MLSTINSPSISKDVQDPRSPAFSGSRDSLPPPAGDDPDPEGGDVQGEGEDGESEAAEDDVIVEPNEIEGLKD